MIYIQILPWNKVCLLWSNLVKNCYNYVLTSRNECPFLWIYTSTLLGPCFKSYREHRSNIQLLLVKECPMYSPEQYFRNVRVHGSSSIIVFSQASWIASSRILIWRIYWDSNIQRWGQSMWIIDINLSVPKILIVVLALCTPRISLYTICNTWWSGAHNI